MLSVFWGKTDYRETVIPAKLLELSYPAEAIAEVIFRKCEHAASFREVERDAGNSDIVILNCEKEGSSKVVHANIGKGAHRKLEEMCRGKKRGDILEAEENGIPVRYRVEKIIARVIPDLTDEIMPVVEPDRKISAADLRAELVREMEEKVITRSAAAVFNMIINKDMKQGDFSMEEKELEALKAEYYVMFGEYGAQQNMSAEEAIRESMRNEPETMTEMEYLHDMALKEMKKALICGYYLEKPKRMEDSDVKFAELVSALQDEFYEKVYELVKNKVRWKEALSHEEN